MYVMKANLLNKLFMGKKIQVFELYGVLSNTLLWILVKSITQEKNQVNIISGFLSEIILPQYFLHAFSFAHVTILIFF